MQVLTIHIIALVLTAAIFIGYLLFIVRPFVKHMQRESRRIAELLSQVRDRGFVFRVLRVLHVLYVLAEGTMRS